MDDRPVWRKRARSWEELRREAEALLLLGPPVVRLLRIEDQVLILEHILPGTPAAERPDDEAMAAVAATLLALWVPVPARCGLPTVHQECAVLDDDQAVAPLPPGSCGPPAWRWTGCCATPSRTGFCTATCTPQNLLWAQGRGWVAIDPHGLVGDPGYDVGPLLINPWNADPVALLDRRLPLLAQLLGMTVERVAAWGLVRAVLAEAWHVQDTGHTAGGALAVAERLTQAVSSDR